MDSAQRDWQEEHDRMVSLVNSLSDAMISVDEHIKVNLFNAAALNILDINTIQNGQSVGELLSIIDTEGNEVDIVQLIRDTQTQCVHRDYRLCYSEEEKINLYLSIAPVNRGYSGGGIKGYVLLMRDITKEKSLEEERDEFISVISHELRTPLTIAEGNLGNALFVAEKTKSLDEQMQSALEQSYDQVLLLASMVNDLSTLSRAERGVLELKTEELNVHEMIELLVKEYTEQAEQKGLKLSSDIDPSLELFRSSRLYVREILQNFITNAIKYTQEGSVTIGAKQKHGGILFEVSDTGIGISKSDQKKVFDKFFRSEDYRTKQSKGTGLGLYVTRKLMRLLDAKMELTSKLNEGSTFSIFIPNSQPDATKESKLD